MDPINDLKLELEQSVNNIIRITTDIRKRSLTEYEMDRQAEIDRLTLEVARLSRENTDYLYQINALQTSVDIMNTELSEYWEIKSAFNLYGELVEAYETMLSTPSNQPEFDIVSDEIEYDRAKFRAALIKKAIEQTLSDIKMWRR